jgi:hypothetical protein
MNPARKSIAERRAWNALVIHHQEVRDLHLRRFFADDATRGECVTLEQMKESS